IIPLAFCRSRADVSGPLPLVNANPYEVGNHSLGSLDISPLPYGGDQAGAFLLRFSLTPSEAVPFPLPLTRFRLTAVDYNRPTSGGALADVPFHLPSLLPT